MQKNTSLEETEKCQNCHKQGSHSSGDVVYFLGLIGALVYFFQHVATFSEGLLATGKALIWPVLVVYHLLTLLKI